MALDPETRSRRIAAARALAGIEKQSELDELLDQDDLGKQVAAKLEGMWKMPGFTVEIAESLARHTGLPTAWFTEPDLTRVFASDLELAERLRRLETRLRALEVRREGSRAKAVERAEADADQPRRAKRSHSLARPGEGENG